MMLERNSVIHADQATYLVVAALSTERGRVYIGAQCGGGLAFAVLAWVDGGWHAAQLAGDAGLLRVIAHSLRADARRRLVAWDPDFVPIARESDLFHAVGEER